MNKTMGKTNSIIQTIVDRIEYLHGEKVFDITKEETMSLIGEVASDLIQDTPDQSFLTNLKQMFYAGVIMANSVKSRQKIIIVGGGASGKDTLRERYESKNYVFGINHTTRPKRDLEIDGKDYNFISSEEFDSLEFLEQQEHNGWKYGLTKENFENSNLFIFSPKSFRSLPQGIKDKCFCILLDIDPKVRLKRLEERLDADSATRRFKQDEIDLGLLHKSEFDLIVTNENF